MNPFHFLEQPLDNFLTFLNEQANLTYGWAIVVLTICVRILILPLFISQYRSGRRMQEIAPQVKQVQAKYKGDKRKQQEETMRLFQEHKVNPFGSCLPMVVQFPVFIALYFVLRNFSQEQTTGDLGFMGIIPDISEQFRDLGWAAVVLAAIYGLSQLLASEVSMATQPQTSEWQRKLFRVMPLFIVAGLFFYPNVPAGLVLYWMTTNLWTCGQQVVLKRRLGPLNLVTDAAGGGRAGRGSEARQGGEAGADAARDDADRGGHPGGGQRLPRNDAEETAPQRRRPEPAAEAAEEAMSDASAALERMFTAILSGMGVDWRRPGDGERRRGDRRRRAGRWHRMRSIGRDGAVIDALQYLAHQTALRASGGEPRKVSVDADGYRERRQRQLERLAEHAASEAIEHREEIELDPMTPHDRRIVHMALADRTDIVTRSEGDEPHRRIVVLPADLAD